MLLASTPLTSKYRGLYVYAETLWERWRHHQRPCCHGLADGFDADGFNANGFDEDQLGHDKLHDFVGNGFEDRCFSKRHTYCCCNS